MRQNGEACIWPWVMADCYAAEPGTRASPALLAPIDHECSIVGSL
jgi:hypothetical protein